MTAHELAKRLLAGPDIPVVIRNEDYVDDNVRFNAVEIDGEYDVVDSHHFGDGSVFYEYDENAKHYTPEEKPFKVLRIG